MSSLKHLKICPGIVINHKHTPEMKCQSYAGRKVIQKRVENSNPPGVCAAPQLVAAAIRKSEIAAEMAEAWCVQMENGGFTLGIRESCETCKELLTKMLCGVKKAEGLFKRQKKNKEKRRKKEEEMKERKKRRMRREYRRRQISRKIRLKRLRTVFQTCSA
ncbi:MAG: hypothetical protein PVJ57_21795 [Phycisphaerae bacterium]|jgi:hypothetical protein